MNEIDASLHELNEDEYGNLITISKWIGITIAVIGEAIKPLLEPFIFHFNHLARYYDFWSKGFL